jgi:glycerate dehydrogenase
LATGYDGVDLVAARRHGIAVTNVPGYSTPAVAQMVFALLLEMTQQVGHYSRLVREEGRWADSPDFCFWDRPLRELAGLHMGLVGFGQIGRQVARVAAAFDMRILVHTAHPNKYQRWQETEGIVFLGLEQLFAQSDVVSLHCPLTSDTAGLVDASLLQLMKQRALLINTARGPLLDEQAVAAALNSGRLAGLGIDVLSSEPPTGDNPLLTAANVHITPHIAWATEEARGRLLDIAVANIKAFLTGESANVVN